MVIWLWAVFTFAVWRYRYLALNGVSSPNVLNDWVTWLVIKGSALILLVLIVLIMK